MGSFLSHRFVASLIAVCATAPLCSQSPAFEVAAIRLSNDPPLMVFGPELHKGHVTAMKVTLRRMVAVAYGMTEPRVIGPDWLDKDRFDIAGKSPEGVPDSELKPMLQALLKDRFKLTAHLEAREMPVYYLVAAKGGVKMALYPAPERRPDDSIMPGFPMMKGSGTTAQLAEHLTFFVNRPVLDETGLPARYNYLLSFAPLSPKTGDNGPELGPADLFTAIQKQLGLKLEPGQRRRRSGRRRSHGADAHRKLRINYECIANLP